MPKNLLLITGASGFVGSHAIRFALESPNYDLILLTNLRELENKFPDANKEIIFLKSDLTKPGDLEKIRQALEAKIDYRITVWHMGGVFNYSASREVLYNVNVLGTKALLEICRQMDTFIEDDGRMIRRLQRFVFWSGGVVYGDFNHPKGKLPADENYPVSPQNNYAWSKKETEDWVLFFYKQLQIPVTIMRIAAIYGPNSRYGMANAIELIASGKLAPVLVGNPNNRAALIHVEDVIRVADFLSWAPEADGEVYNVVDDTPYTLKEMSVFLGRELNNEPFTSFSLPPWVLNILIKLVNRKAKWLDGVPVIDPELCRIALLNAWMSNEKLKALAAKHGRKDLLKYPYSRLGLAETIHRYKKEGRR